MSSDRESYTFRVGISLVIHNRLEEVKITLDSLSQAITDLDRICLVDNASSNREDLDRLKKSYQQFQWLENSENLGYAGVVSLFMLHFFSVCFRKVGIPHLKVCICHV